MLIGGDLGTVSAAWAAWTGAIGPAPGPATTYTYDYADRLRTATVGATTETYAYAGDGVRLSASTGAGPGQTTKALWDRVFGLPQLALERDGADALLRAYRYGWDLVSQAAGGNTYAYHHDGLGSVADLTGPAGTSLSWREYAPYGEVRLAGVGAGAPAIDPFAFTGEQRDGLTGLYHLRARQYDPATGRFLTTDPEPTRARTPYTSSYGYSQNNPIRFVDPSGRISIGLCATPGFTFLGFGVGFSACLVFASGGQVGLTVSGGGGGRVGAELGVGVVVQVSSVDYLQDLAGPFADVGGSAKLAGGIEGSLFGGEGFCHQPVVGGTLGPALGGGAELHALITVTQVVGYLGSTRPACSDGASK